MIYEYHGQDGRFFIEWNRWPAWGADNETKWVCTHKGMTLAQGPAPEVVLDAVRRAKAELVPTGMNLAAVRLPPSLAEWSTGWD